MQQACLALCVTFEYNRQLDILLFYYIYNILVELCMNVYYLAHRWMAGSRMQDGAEDAGVADEEEEQDMEVEQDSNPYVGLDARAMEILKGCLEDLPRLPTKTVRIFLSSTFSGTVFDIKQIKY